MFTSPSREKRRLNKIRCYVILFTLLVTFCLFYIILCSRANVGYTTCVIEMYQTCGQSLIENNQHVSEETALMVHDWRNFRNGTDLCGNNNQFCFMFL